MKLVITLLFLSSMVAAAQQPVAIPIAITNTLNDQPKTVVLTLAAHINATNDLDTALGEREIPSLPPPAGVFIAYTIPPSTEYLWLSPLDVRKLEIGKQHLVEYTIGMTWNAGKLDISWGMIPSLVDSAYLVDVVSDFPDNFIKVKLEPNKTYSTINTAITKLKLLVWYNATSLNVTEDVSPVSLYPNPFEDELILEGANLGSHFNVVDVSGSVIFTGIIDQQRQMIRTAELPTGMYALQLQNIDGSVVTRKLLRR
jgi:hypothetical protein